MNLSYKYNMTILIKSKTPPTVEHTIILCAAKKENSAASYSMAQWFLITQPLLKGLLRFI